jgi:hypothetical protein
MQTDDQTKKSVSANKQFLTELTMAFVKHLDETNCQTLFRVLKPQFSDTDGTLQKKSFKVLLSICEYQPAFVNAHLAEVTEVLLHTLLSCTPAAKKARLRCLRQVLAIVPPVDLSKLTLAVRGKEKWGEEREQGGEREERRDGEQREEREERDEREERVPHSLSSLRSLRT